MRSSFLQARTFEAQGQFSLLPMELDATLASLTDEIQNPLGIGAMVGGGLAFRSSHVLLSRLASPLLAESRFVTHVLAQGAIRSASLFMEVATFRSISHGSINIFQGKEFISDAITFGILKGAGRLAHGSNIVLTHLLQAGGMVAAQNAAAGLGIAAASEENLFQQFAHAEGTNIRLGLAMSLVGRISPGLAHLERSMDVQSEALSRRTERKSHHFSARRINMEPWIYSMATQEESSRYGIQRVEERDAVSIKFNERALNVASMVHGGITFDALSQVLVHAGIENPLQRGGLKLTLNAPLFAGSTYEGQWSTEGSQTTLVIPHESLSYSSKLVYSSGEMREEGFFNAREDLAALVKLPSERFAGFPNCVAMGERHPQGMKLPMYYPSEGTLNQVWIPLPEETVSHSEALFSAMDMVAWVAAQIDSATPGLTNTIDYHSLRAPIPGEKVFVVASVPEGETRNYFRDVEIHVIQTDGQVLGRGKVGIWLDNNYTQMFQNIEGGRAILDQISRLHNRRRAERLEARLRDFTLERLSVDPTGGPPYALPPEVDPQRTLEMAQGGNRIRVNRSTLNRDVLRDPKTRILFATAPESDFVRTFELDGETHQDLMFDVMGSMTSLANRGERTLHSVAPNYPLEFIKANLPPGRVKFESPRDMEAFQRSVLEYKPDLLLLSGLNVNTRALLEMALFARQQGVKEIWLGGDAAIAPYKILDEAFDRTIWGPAEEYLHHELVGDEFPGHRHPAVDQMRASVKWFVPQGDNDVRELNFETLHMVLRMGCTQNCVYCAEGIKSDRGKMRPPTSWEEAKALIDEAHEKGIRRVYFIDPDFGRLWDDELEGRVLAYLHERQMRWSCLSNVVTLQRHGDYMMQHGLASVYLGIESLSPDHDPQGEVVSETGGKVKLKILKRGWQDQQETVRQALRLRDNGVMVFGLYILFNPGETLDGIREGVRRLGEIVPLSQISTNQPFPGTAEFVTAVEKGYIFNFDPDYVRYGQMVWTPEGQVFLPLLVSREYIASHRNINPLDRAGGFFETQRRFRQQSARP